MPADGRVDTADGSVGGKTVNDFGCGDGLVLCHNCRSESVSCAAVVSALVASFSGRSRGSPGGAEDADDPVCCEADSCVDSP